MQNPNKAFDSIGRLQQTIPRSSIAKNLEISTSKNELQKVWQLRTAEYNKHYSEFSCNDDDSYDTDALVLYSKNQQGQLISTGRIVFDSPQGLPADSIIKAEVSKLRKQGLNIAELSKLAISEEASGILHEYIQTFYKVAVQQNIDSLIFICKDSSAIVYRRLVGAKMLVKNIQYSYGTDFTFSLLEWRIKESKYHKTHNVSGGCQMNKQAITYPVSEWEKYARLHASVTTSFQLAVYEEACKHLSGNIVDCGCGTAKIAPLLADNNSVMSYTGVDFAEEMVIVSKWILQKLQRSSFIIEHSKIEDLEGKEGYFTSAVSIQSYYSWPNPLLTLSHIYKMLASDGVFILVTPNQSLSLEKLAKEAEKELIAHPDFEEFKAYNSQLASNTQANFISMGGLIYQVQEVGFKVLECHQNHFLGGLNFLVLKKE